MPGPFTTNPRRADGCWFADWWHDRYHDTTNDWRYEDMDPEQQARADYLEDGGDPDYADIGDTFDDDGDDGPAGDYLADYWFNYGGPDEPADWGE